MSTPPVRRSLFALLFVPAMAVMSRLTFGRKFILLGVLLSGPLAFIVYLQADSAGERVEFNRRERIGVAYLVPLMDFLYRVQLQRIYVAAARPLPDSARARIALEATVAHIDNQDGRDGTLLGTREEWASIRTSWRRLCTAPPAGRAALDAAHERISSRVAEHLLRLLGNYSNLFLDPDLDSYWLMDALLVKLPLLTETVTRASAVSLGLHSGATSAGLERANRLAADYWRELDGIKELVEVDLATAFRETGRFGRSATLEKNLTGRLAAAERAVRRHAELLRHAQAGPELGSKMVEAAGEALHRLYLLAAGIAPELDALIKARIEHYHAKRTQGLVAAATVALVLTYLLIGIYLSVRSSVSALQQVSADSHAPALPPAKDEIGQIAVAYSRAQTEKSQLEEQLRAAEKLATIGTLAAGTAHELNEPLGAILGFAELAGKAPSVPSSTLRDLEKISGAALHAREVIKKLLLFARQTPPQKKRLDIRQVVHEALDFLQGRFDVAAIGLQRDLEEVPPVLADASQLRQVVLNLTVNALQASHGGGQVRVSLRAESGHAVLQVADDGKGMSPEVREQIFVPFFTTKDVGQGTGLGLSVVHGIISAHGGTIEVVTRPGEGARFVVRLPLVASEG